MCTTNFIAAANNASSNIANTNFSALAFLNLLFETEENELDEDFFKVSHSLTHNEFDGSTFETLTLTPNNIPDENENPREHLEHLDLYCDMLAFIRKRFSLLLDNYASDWTFLKSCDDFNLIATKNGFFNLIATRNGCNCQILHTDATLTITVAHFKF